MIAVYLSKLICPCGYKRAGILLTLIIKQGCYNLEGDFNVFGI